MLFLLSLLSLLQTDSPPEMSPKKTNLIVEVQNVKTLKGSVFFALFKSGDSFPNGKPVDGKKVDANAHNVRASFSLDPGEYAVAVFHDENGNGQLDKKIFGIPKEPYGFSNNFRPKMSAPKFKDCQFTIDGSEKMITIKVESF
ncbi:hypothetical protein GCM10028805_02280 [Spirosoma harenae]